MGNLNNAIAIRWRDIMPLGGLCFYLAMYQFGRFVECFIN